MVQKINMSQVEIGPIATKSTVYHSKNWHRNKLISTYMHNMQIKSQPIILQDRIVK